MPAGMAPGPAVRVLRAASSAAAAAASAASSSVTARRRGGWVPLGFWPLPAGVFGFFGAAFLAAGSAAFWVGFCADFALVTGFFGRLDPPASERAADDGEVDRL